MGAATPTAMEALTATTAPPSMDQSGSELVVATTEAAILAEVILVAGILGEGTAADMGAGIIDIALFCQHRWEDKRR